MGTTSEKIIEKFDSLLKMIDEDHQEILHEISRCNTYLECIQNIIEILAKLEEKLDYIKALPEKKEE